MANKEKKEKGKSNSHRFIHNTKLTRTYVEQDETATFEEVYL